MGTRRMRDALEVAAQQLAQAGLDAPFFEARVLLAHVLRAPLNRLDLLASSYISPALWEQLMALVAERTTRRPLSYIIGETEFMGLRLRCDERAFVPRPETELLVEVVVDAMQIMPKELTILDIGTGTGAVGLALAVMLPASRVVLTDVSPGALQLARENAKALQVADRVRFLQGTDLDPVIAAGLAEEIGCLVSNPPYVAPKDVTNLPPEVACYEPKLAWLGNGEAGTGFYERVIPRCRQVLSGLRLVAFEVGVGQARFVRELCRQVWPSFDVSTSRDLSGIERVILARA